MPSIFILDFNDSFTWNIARYFQLRAHVEVIAFQTNLEQTHAALTALAKKEKIGLILGPGPGHPDDYPQYQKIVAWALNCPQVFVLGICLGHQIIGRQAGMKLDYLPTPMHGLQWSFRLREGNKIWTVQSYNSLYFNWENQESTNLKRFSAVVVVENRVEMLSWARGVSYQFHPESSGTTYQHPFFKPLLEFFV